MADRLRLRQTFNSAAALYDRARPAYPAELFEALLDQTGVGPGDHVLEVGCATGIATRPLADRGLRVVTVELGEDLARAATANLSGFPDVEVVCANFESWQPPRCFDLLVAATSWHWIDPEIRYQRAWGALRPGGHLAFWNATHVFPEDGDPFFDEIQDVYEQIGEGHPDGAPRPRPDLLPDSLDEVLQSGLFTNAAALRFDWEVIYSADGYIDLLNTFSNHIAMTRAQRETLYRAIRERIAQRRVPQIARHWGVVLHIAQRIGSSPLSGRHQS